MSQNPPSTPSYIDPLAMAQFLVLPGAAELLSAFAAIPPGKLRQTIIDHAQALAEAHQGAQPHQRGPGPLGAVLGLPQPRAALPRRTDAEPPTKDPRTTAVKMRLDGKLPYEIAEATGLKLSTVYGAITEARKAGVNFPKTGRAPPGKGKQTTRFAMSVDELDGVGAATAGRAAKSRGITLEVYFERRRTAIRMGLDGRHIRAIMEATKEPMSVLKSWFSAARSAGYNVPYMIDGIPAQFEDANVAPAPKIVDLGQERQWRQGKKKGKKTGHHLTFVTSEAEVNGKGRVMIDKAAAAMGLTRAQYFEKRAAALAHFQSGKYPSEVAQLLGITAKQAQNWCSRATMAGKLKRA